MPSKMFKKITLLSPKNRRIIKNLAQSFRPHLFMFSLVLLFSLISIVVAAIAPKILWQIIDLAVADLKASRPVNFTLIGGIATWLLVIYFVFVLFSFLSNLILAKISAKYTASLREAVFKKIHSTPILELDRKKTGEVITIINDDASTIGEVMAHILSRTIRQFFEFWIVLVIMFTISVPLTLIVLIFTMLTFWVAKFYGKKLHDALEQRRKFIGSLNSDIEEFYSSQILIHSNAMTEKIMERIEQKIQAVTFTTKKSFTIQNDLSAILSPSITWFGATLTSLVGAFMVLQQKLSFGAIQAITSYAWRFSETVSGLVRVSSEFQQIITSAERIFDFLSLPEQPKDLDLAKLSQKPQGRVTFDQVCFEYQGTPVIKNFSLEVPAGSKVAIVGPTGSGKTTIIHLLMRFFDHTSGQILIDDIPIDQISRHQLRSIFGMVLQDTWLSPDTIYQNLTYGNKKLTQSEVEKVTKLSNAHHIIEALPKGYQTMLSEDAGGLSAGEKQLLTIARAMIKDPAILVLDEATSNIDTRTEQLIQDSLKKLLHGRTAFVIAHRLSTIIDADIIVVLKAGEIVEVGNHQTLLKKSGHYKELYYAQFAEEDNS